MVEDMVMVPRKDLQAIADAYAKWNPEAAFASSVLYRCSRDASDILDAADKVTTT